MPETCCKTCASFLRTILAHRTPHEIPKAQEAWKDFEAATNADQAIEALERLADYYPRRTVEYAALSALLYATLGDQFEKVRARLNRTPNPDEVQ